MGATLDAPDKTGRTPLHWAAFKKCYDACNALIEVGANVHAIDDNGDTPDMTARSVDPKGMAKLLYRSHERPMNISTRTAGANRDAILFGMILPVFSFLVSLCNYWFYAIVLSLCTFYLLRNLAGRDINDTRNWAYVTGFSVLFL